MTYKSLFEDYKGFLHPVVEVIVNEKSLTTLSGKTAVGVSNLRIDLTAGFEASQAIFNVYNVYNYAEGSFDFSIIKQFVLLGAPVMIYAGYEKSVSEIFSGVVVKTNFVIEEGDVAHLEVTCMDVKSVMMANRYSRSFTSLVYSEAITELFNQSIYKSLMDAKVIDKINVQQTPDKMAVSSIPEIAVENEMMLDEETKKRKKKLKTDRTIEMVGESDYEFVVKVARKFNYDFFVLGGEVIFRKAKSDQSVLIDIPSRARIRRLSVEYDMTGLVEKVEVRGLNVGQNKVVNKTLKNSYKLSQGSKAKQLISGSKFVYVDPTVSTADDASNRANYLFEEMTHRYGTLDLEMVGIPEIVPGRYISISGVGTAVSNEFYVQSVSHIFSADGRYSTRIIGKTNQQKSGGLI